MRLRLNMPQLMKRVGDRRQELAEVIERQTKERIEAGGDPGEEFAPLVFPRADGSTDRPLARPGFLSTIHGFTTDRGFGVRSDHANAARLFRGTTGKGGTEPPIRAPKGGFLKFKSAGLWVRIREANFKARKFIAVTAENVAEYGRVLFGQ